MRYGKRFIGFLTAALLAAAVFFGKSEYAWNGTVCLSVTVSAGERTEEIPCWENEDGEYYIFLPGYAELSRTRLNSNTSNAVYLDGRRLTKEMTCEGLQLDVPYDLCYMAKGEAHHFTVTFAQSANVAAMYIDTASGSMEHIREAKENEEPGTLRLYTETGALDYAGNLESIKGRGNSTWDLAKKPYNLTLNTEGDLLGMGAAKRWILLANAMDSSQLRNKIVYDFARDAGLAYSPECAWVDLYLNGEYAGVYLLCERNEVHAERVGIGQGDSFLVSKDWEWRFEENGQPFIMTQASAALRIHYSDFSADALLEIWQSAENAILAEDGIDPVTGKHWRELIDLDSWAGKYLVEEIFANPDAATLSQFFYYDGGRSGKIYAGPVWDFDLAMANTSAWEYPAPNMFFANLPTIYGSPWFHALYGQEEFLNRVRELYQTEFQPLLAQLLEDGVEDYAARIAQAAQMDQLRWGFRDPEEETEAILRYMTERMDFLNHIWLDQEETVYVMVKTYEGAKLAYGLRPGECLPALPVYESDEETVIHGWFNLDTKDFVDITQPIYEDTRLELSYEERTLPEPEETVPETTEPKPAEEEPQPEPPKPIKWSSLLRLAPALVFAGMLMAVCVAGLLQCWRSREKSKETA